jgi:hypothetical protein
VSSNVPRKGGQFQCAPQCRSLTCGPGPAHRGICLDNREQGKRYGKPQQQLAGSSLHLEITLTTQRKHHHLFFFFRMHNHLFLSTIRSCSLSFSMFVTPHSIWVRRPAFVPLKTDMKGIPCGIYSFTSTSTRCRCGKWADLSSTGHGDWSEC